MKASSFEDIQPLTGIPASTNSLRTCTDMQLRSFLLRSPGSCHCIPMQDEKFAAVFEHTVESIIGSFANNFVRRLRFSQAPTDYLA
jgi:hypothetical protein